jgi:sortase A
MKRLIALILTLLLTLTAAVPAMAADYDFFTGGGTPDGFGTSTSTDATVIPDPLNTNTRRNKDAAVLPPPYGIFSGDIPTDPSSPYHNNLPESGSVSVNQELPPVGNTGSPRNEVSWGGSEDYAPGSSNVTTGLLSSASQTVALNTAPWYYEDGSIGSLCVSLTGKTIKVYEGENLSNLKKGAGHFSSTSAWDGNVALAGHNRGSAAYFSFVKDLEEGDTLTYTTGYGTRTYKVVSKTQINEWDSLPLSRSGENILTLITCVAGVPENRYCVVAKEVK